MEKNHLLENAEYSLVFSLDLPEINSIGPIGVPALVKTVPTQVELDTRAGISCLFIHFIKTN